MRDTQREVKTQAEGEPTQGAGCGTQSGAPGPHPELKAVVNH